MLRGSGSEPQLPVSHAVTGENDQVTVHCVASTFWTSGFVFSHPVMSIKCPPVSPASGAKREALTLEMTTARLQVCACSEQVYGGLG